MTFRFSPTRRTMLAWPTIALTTALFGCASTPVPPRPPIDQGDFTAVGQYADQRMAAEMAKWKVKGASIAIVDDQRVVFAKGYGLADDTSGQAATPDTTYRVGSISKLLTATEVMRRVERREIDLDGPFSGQLPGFRIRSLSAGGKPLTVRSMLAHHSGLPSDQLKGMWLPEPASLQDLQASLADEYLAAPPQTKYLYSNLDYSLLGRLVEVKGKADFASVIAQGLLRPLGMTASRFESGAAPVGPIAKPHRNGQEVAAVGLRDAPAGALLSSTNDLAAYLRFMFGEGQVAGKPVLGRAALDAMLTPQFDGLPIDFGHKMGLGWMLSGVSVPGAGEVAWHTGEYPGYFSAILMSRGHKLGVVILANDESAKKFALDAGQKMLATAIEVKTGVRAATEEPARRPQRAAVPQRDLDQLTGNYVMLGSLSRISRDGDQLSADIFGTNLDLVPTAANRFVLQKSVLGLVAVPLENLAVEFSALQGNQYAVLRGLPAPLRFERIDRRPVPASWQSRLGTYATGESDNNMTFGPLELVIEDGVLVAKTRIASTAWGTPEAPVRVALAPSSDTEAVVSGADGLAGSVLAVRTRDGEEGLRYSGYFFRRTSAAPRGAAKP